MSYNEWLDIDVLEDYLDGKLDAATMHKVERISLDDPFVAEALAGLSQSPKRAQTLSLLQKQLQQRIAQKPVQEKRWRITAQRLSIGAAAAVLFVTVSILYWMKQNSQRTQLAGDKKVEVQVAPQAATVILPTDSAPKTPQVTTPQKELVPKLQTDRAIASGKNAAANKEIAAARNKAAAERNGYSVALAQQQMASAKRKAQEETDRAMTAKAEGVVAAVQQNLAVPNATINGRVYAKDDGQPLPGAVVRLAGTNKTTTTNTNGEFTLPADSSSQRLSVGYIGYVSQNVQVQANQQVNVALEADQHSLNEVMVTAAGKKVGPKIFLASRPANAAPTGGWEAFENYLRTNHRLYKEGSQTIRLRFSVDKNGRPKQIEVRNGLAKAENEEAIRLIQQGPSWTIKSPEGYAELSIRF